MKLRFNLAILFLVCTLSVWAEGYTADNLPIPYLKDARRHTCNPDNVLSDQAVATIDSAMFRIEQTHGVQSLVIVVKNVEGGDCYEFGMDLSRKYKLGSKSKNSGLIIILSTEDRRYQILTGDGLEGVLPDAICKRIENRKMLPFLKKKDWDSAMIETVKAACDYIEGDESLIQEEADDAEKALIAFAIVVAMIILGVLCIFLAVYSASKCPHCGQHKLQRASSIQLSKKKGIITKQVTYICKNCGHTVVKTEKEEDDNYFNGGGPIIIGGGGRSGFGGGGGFSGGSFGGGHFSGGGAGGSF